MPDLRVHERISVHSVCFPAADMDELFRNWATLGVERVSLSSGQVFDYGPARVRALIDAGGHRTETLTHVFSTRSIPVSGSEVAAARAALSRAIETAQILGARSLYMLTGGRGMLEWEEAADAFASAIAPCVAEAEGADVALAIENTSPFFAHGHLANNLRDTLLLAETAGIGVCIDYFACWTEAGIRELIASALPRLRLVQFSDYVAGDRALPCRAVPGDGAINWPRVLRWLHEAGYTGTYDLELIGPRIDAEGQLEAVTRAVKTFGRWLRELDA
jgi:sugar phosphate isomerase/epimerase